MIRFYSVFINIAKIVKKKKEYTVELQWFKNLWYHENMFEKE